MKRGRHIGEWSDLESWKSRMDYDTWKEGLVNSAYEVNVYEFKVLIFPDF